VLLLNSSTMVRTYRTMKSVILRRNIKWKYR